ncbi:hypothetical protein L596_021634 [Steinernema carpocapsae]|nr:hypothetical protein L596_021634 [Steinernema carpocapsae]
MEYLILRRSDFEMAILPVHVNNDHWIAAIVDVRRHCIMVYDSLRGLSWQLREDLLKTASSLAAHRGMPGSFTIREAKDDERAMQPDTTSCGVYTAHHLKEAMRQLAADRTTFPASWLPREKEEALRLRLESARILREAFGFMEIDSQEETSDALSKSMSQLQTCSTKRTQLEAAEMCSTPTKRAKRVNTTATPENVVTRIYSQRCDLSQKSAEEIAGHRRIQKQESAKRNREKRRQQAAENRQQKRETINAAEVARRAKNREEVNSAEVTRRAVNREEVNASQNARRADNREEVNAAEVARRAVNREEVNASQNARRADNREEVNASQNARRAQIRRSIDFKEPTSRCAKTTHIGLGCASKTVNHRIQQFHVGEFDQRCPYCHALQLKSEKGSLLSLILI